MHWSLQEVGNFAKNLEEHGSDQHDRAAESKEKNVDVQLLDDGRSGSSRRTVRRGRLGSRRPVTSTRPVATESGPDTAFQRGHRRARLSHVESGVCGEPSTGRTSDRRSRLGDARTGDGRGGLDAASVVDFLDVALLDVPLGLREADLLQVHVEDDVCGTQECLAKDDGLVVVDGEMPRAHMLILPPGKVIGSPGLSGSSIGTRSSVVST